MPETPEPESPEPAASQPPVPEHEEAGADAVEGGGPAPNRKWFILFALLFLVAFVGIRWWYFTGQALEKVAVESSVPACTDTTIGDVKADGESVAAPDVVPGMRCEVILNVVNQGTKTLTLSQIVMPGLGTDSPLPVKAAEIDGITPVNDGDDAIYKIDKPLGGGEFLELNVAYEYDETGCLESPTYTDARWPTVEVKASNRSRSVDADRTFALHGTDESMC